MFKEVLTLTEICRLQGVTIGVASRWEREGLLRSAEGLQRQYRWRDIERTLYLSTSSVAHKCGVTLDAVEEWDETGVLVPAGYTPKGHPRYRLADVEALIESRKREKLLTTDEVAKQFDVTRRRVQIWSRRGKLPVADHTQRGQNLYRQEDVDQLKELHALGTD